MGNSGIDDEKMQELMHDVFESSKKVHSIAYYDYDDPDDEEDIVDNGDYGRTNMPIAQGMAGMTDAEEREYYREWDEDIQKRKNAVPEEPISALSFDPDDDDKDAQSEERPLTALEAALRDELHAVKQLNSAQTQEMRRMNRELDTLRADHEDKEEIPEPTFFPLHGFANPKTYRKLPIEVQGLEWTGTNVHEMRDFVGKHGQTDNTTGEWSFLTPVEISGVMESSAIVWDDVQRAWVPVHLGDTILRGVNGEFYPISPEILCKTYEEVK